ncbi:DoxX family protein [Armatimonas rosea]|uniref:DoxX-like family protein n=1 Tax=Armatimonas rosea TaxID=685828 RepID=A0A7W9W6U3_ARMRO|nr:DoxX family protein [Armatimonas rosea]MBB6051814.1 hypothetical protein [Armatimonas rosea]
MKRTPKLVLGWVATCLFALAMTGSGVMSLTGNPRVVASLQALGYPMFLPGMLGVAKLAGAAALFTQDIRLREWAYAGFTFLLLGAGFSHLLAGQPLPQSLPPFVLLVLSLVSYLLRQRCSLSRKEELY